MKPSYEELEQELTYTKQKLASTEKELASTKQELASTKQELANLQVLFKQALARIAQLEEQIKRNSKNSSKPPSSDQKGNTPNKDKKPRSSRKGKARTPYPPERVNHQIDCHRSECPHCQSKSLKPLDSFAWQQVELPKAPAIVTQYNLEKYRCLECGKRCMADLPKGVGLSSFGPKLIALISTLTGQFHVGKREALALIKALYDIDVSTGSVINLEEQVATALKEPYERIHSFVVNGPFPRYFDETTWRNNGKRAYVWIATNQQAACYRIDPSRSRAAFLKLIGDATAPPSVTDRYNVYKILNGEHQYCLAHLIRKFHGFSQREGEDGFVGAHVEQELKRICQIHSQWRKDKISDRQKAARFKYSKKRLKTYFGDGVHASDEVYDLCNRLLESFDNLVACEHSKKLEPTNNLAERDLRKLVLWRKKSYGTRSARGQCFVERITSVVETLKKNGGHVLIYLEEALKALYLKESPPLISAAHGF